MAKDKQKNLRMFYNSFLQQQKIFDSFPSNAVQVKGQTILPLEQELYKFNSEFPDIMPVFNKNDYYLFTSTIDKAIFNLPSIRSYLAILIGRLKVAIEESSDIPITEKRLFSFINNTELRHIIERDYSEIQKAYISNCWKSVIVLCGGTIEAILTDLLISNEASAKSAKAAPNKPDITRWDLSELINVAVELKEVSVGVERLSNSIREYRNLVHPSREIRNKLYFGAEEARIAVEVLNILHRELSK